MQLGQYNFGHNDLPNTKTIIWDLSGLIQTKCPQLVVYCTISALCIHGIRATDSLMEFRTIFSFVVSIMYTRLVLFSFLRTMDPHFTYWLVESLYEICSTLSLAHFANHLARSQQNTKLSACQRSVEVEIIYSDNTSKNALEIHTQIFVNKNLRLNDFKSGADTICDQ